MHRGHGSGPWMHRGRVSSPWMHRGCGSSLWMHRGQGSSSGLLFQPMDLPGPRFQPVDAPGRRFQPRTCPCALCWRLWGLQAAGSRSPCQEEPSLAPVALCRGDLGTGGFTASPSAGVPRLLLSLRVLTLAPSARLRRDRFAVGFGYVGSQTPEPREGVGRCASPFVGHITHPGNLLSRDLFCPDRKKTIGNNVESTLTGESKLPGLGLILIGIIFIISKQRELPNSGWKSDKSDESS